MTGTLKRWRSASVAPDTRTRWDGKKVTTTAGTSTVRFWKGSDPTARRFHVSRPQVLLDWVEGERDATVVPILFCGAVLAHPVAAKVSEGGVVCASCARLSGTSYSEWQAALDALTAA